MSSIKSLKNNYYKLQHFLGIFIFIAWLGFTLNNALKNKICQRVFHPGISCKLIDYNKCIETQNKISLAGLKTAQIPNYKIKINPGIMSFWQILQDAINKNFRASFILDQNISERMSIVIDNDKHHLN